MNDNWINELRKKYLELGECTEEEIKIKIVRPLLENLGYEERWFKYEYPVIKNKKITDITILRNGSLDMVIEVKKNSLKGLKEDDMFQLLNYLNIKNIEWGILTNGKEYLLINNKIDNAEYKDKLVFSFDLLDLSQESDLKHYSIKSIFIDRTTYYQKYLAQFKVYKFKEKDNYNSWVNFKSTIEKYFEFLSKKYGFRNISHLNTQDFKDFLNFDIEQSKRRRKEITSKITIINKYRHINGFYELFLKNSNEIVKNPFRYISEEQMCDGIDCKDKEEILTDYDQVVIKQILEHFDKYTNEPERNKIIFLLCLYAGLSRDDIRFLKLDHFNDDERVLYLHGRKVPLNKEFYARIKNYIDNIRDKHARVNYVFYSNYGDCAGQPFDKSTINSIIRKAVNRLETKSEVPLKINPENIRKVLIRKFFNAGFSLEEIITSMNIEISRISDYISTEEIIERTDLYRICDLHPYKDFFV